MKRLTIYSFLVFFNLLSCICAGQNKLIDSLNLAFKNAKNDTTKAKVLIALSEEYYAFNTDSVIPLCMRAIKIIEKKEGTSNPTEKISLLTSKANALNNIGAVQNATGNIPEALENYSKSLALQTQLKNKEGIGTALNNIAYIYNNQGDIPKALDYYEKCIKIWEELKAYKNQALTINNVALIYQYQGDTAKAMSYYKRSLKIRQEINDKDGIGYSLNNIATLLNSENKPQLALEYQTKALQIFEESGNPNGISLTCLNMAYLYRQNGDIPKALELYNRSIAIQKQMQNKHGIANTQQHIAMIYQQLMLESNTPSDKKKYCSLAHAYADSSLSLSKELGYPINIAGAEKILYQTDSTAGNFSGALEHYKNFIASMDSIQNEKTRKASIKNQLQYEYDKKEAVITEQQNKERAVAHEKSRFQLIVIGAVIFGLLLVITFAFYVFRSLKATRTQKLIIEEKQREIIDSIRYAKRIQNSLLPPEKYIEKSINRLKKS